MTCLGNRVYAQHPDGRLLRFRDMSCLMRYESKMGDLLFAMSRRSFIERRESSYRHPRWRECEVDGAVALFEAS